MRNLFAIVRIGAANSNSVAHALQRSGATPFFLDRPEQLRQARALVIPGVAHAGYMIAGLDRRGLRDGIRKYIGLGLPTLGICAGYQILFDASEEAPLMRGLGVLNGVVRRLVTRKLPHMGWNEVVALSNCIPSGWAYFAHSFAPAADVADAVAITEVDVPFASAVRKDNVFGLQFHPERSGQYGARILDHFVQRAIATKRYAC